MTITIEKILNKKTLAHLENLFSNTDILKNFPIFENNNLRIGKFLITKTIDGFEVSCVDTNKILAFFYNRGGAIAFVQNRMRKLRLDKKIQDLDWIIVKQNNDCIFYKNSIKKSKNRKHKISLLARIDLAQQSIKDARTELQEIIFNQ